MAENAENRIKYPGGTDTNAFYIDVKVFLEGVQIPHAACAVSYGIDSPPTCTITLPASSFLREIPETTKILVIYKDLLPDPKTNEYEWRLLFDGEASGFSYSVTPNGANITLSGVHTAAYLTLMQFTAQSVSEHILNRAPELLGDHVIMSPAGVNKTHIDFITRLLGHAKGTFNSMADISYLILRNMIEGFKDKGGPVAAWYWNKLGPVVGGYKILDRLAGISEPVINLPVMDCNFSEDKNKGDNVKPKEEKQQTSTTTDQTSTESKQQSLEDRIFNGWIEHPELEGTYDSINWNDNGKGLSVGIIGFHDGNIDIILSETGTDLASKYIGVRSKSDVLARGGQNTAEAEFRALLRSPECKAAQQKVAKSFIPTYIAEVKAAGVTNPDSIVYAALWCPTVGMNRMQSATMDIGVFIKNRKAWGTDVNNPAELAKHFVREYGQVMAEGFDYGTRWKTTLNYVNSTKSTSTTTSQEQEPAKIGDTVYQQKYNVPVENTQRIDD